MTSTLVIGSVGDTLPENEQLLLEKIKKEIRDNEKTREDFEHWVTITKDQGHPFFLMLWSSVDGAMLSGMPTQGEEISETQKRAKTFFEEHVNHRGEADLILFLIDVNEEWE